MTKDMHSGARGTGVPYYGWRPQTPAKKTCELCTGATDKRCGKPATERWRCPRALHIDGRFKS